MMMAVLDASVVKMALVVVSCEDEGPGPLRWWLHGRQQPYDHLLVVVVVGNTHTRCRSRKQMHRLVYCVAGTEVERKQHDHRPRPQPQLSGIIGGPVPPNWPKLQRPWVYPREFQ